MKTFVTYISTVILISCFLKPYHLKAQFVNWTASASVGAASSTGTGITTDNYGNIYSIGTYRGNVTFLDTTLVGNSSDEEFFITKYDRLGNRLWIRQFSGTRDCFGGSIKADSKGFVYFSGNPSIGSLTLDSAVGVSAAFIAKMDSSGKVHWAKHIPSNTASVDIIVDSNSNCYTTFSSSQSGSFGHISVYISGTHQKGVGKFDKDGNAIWAKTFDELLNKRASISLDNVGNLIASKAGHWTLIPSGVSSGQTLLETINSVNGNKIKEDTIINGAAEAVLAIDNYGNYILTGTFKSVVNFGKSTLSPVGNNDLFIASYSSNGTENWVRHIKSLGINSQNCIVNDLGIDQYNNYFFCGRIAQMGVFGNDTIKSRGSVDGFMCKFDYLGNYVWAKNLGGNGGIPENCTKIEVNQYGVVLTTGRLEGLGYFGDSIIHPNTYGIYVAKVIDSSNYISGEFFIDYNQNGIFDSLELVIPNHILSVHPSFQTTISNQSGQYTFQVDSGTHTITPRIFKYHTITPNAYTINLNSYGLVSEKNNFIAHPIFDITDLQIDITALSPTRSGFTTAYQITYKNTGTDTVDGSVNFYFDPLLIVDSLSHTPNLQSNDSITWNYTSLLPQESRIIIAYLKTNINAMRDSIVTLKGRIEPINIDTVPQDNYDSLFQVITGSYDPNDKLVSLDSIISINQIQNNTPFEYTIRFQNTGTDTAFTVIIRDTISQLLKLETFEIISSSHNYDLILNNQSVEFIFSNILLPDSNTNPIKSQGFIKYRIKPRSTVIVGQEIKNKAHIYFDFNSPIITNTVKNLVIKPTYIDEHSNNINGTILLYPNPTNNNINYSLKLVNHEQIDINIYTIDGTLITTLRNPINKDVVSGSINLSNITKGLYLLEIKGSKTKIYRTLIKN